VPPALSLAARERLLEQTRYSSPAPPTAALAPTPPGIPQATKWVRANAFVPPDLTDEHGSTVTVPRAAPTPSGRVAVPPSGPASPLARPPDLSGTSAPAYRASLPADSELNPHPQNEPDAPAPSAAPLSTPATSRVNSAPAVTSAGREAVHPAGGAPPHAAVREPRESAPHSDRSSRERVLR
jgi:hypothetical protein